MCSCASGASDWAYAVDEEALAYAKKYLVTSWVLGTFSVWGNSQYERILCMREFSVQGNYQYERILSTRKFSVYGNSHYGGILIIEGILSIRKFSVWDNSDYLVNFHYEESRFSLWGKSHYFANFHYGSKFSLWWNSQLKLRECYLPSLLCFIMFNYVFF